MPFAKNSAAHIGLPSGSFGTDARQIGRAGARPSRQGPSGAAPEKTAPRPAPRHVTGADGVPESTSVSVTVSAPAGAFPEGTTMTVTEVSSASVESVVEQAVGEEVTEIKDGGKRVTSEKKVFPGYVLVRMELDDHTWSVVRNTPGVTGFVGAEGKPIPLTREEYQKIMGRSSIDIPKKTSTDITVGQVVKVVNGPLAEFDGTVTEVLPEAGKVRVMVSIFGRETPVELSFDQVAKV